jgi:hypothetical protein
LSDLKEARSLIDGKQLGGWLTEQQEARIREREKMTLTAFRLNPPVHLEASSIRVLTGGDGQ